MNAIDILVKEHDSILKMIEITQTVLNSKNETNIDLDHVEKMIDFIKNFADKYHHLKEEDVLFMEMEKHGMPREGGPIGVMLHEHNEGRAFIKAAVEGIAKLKTGDSSAFKQIKENLLNYCELLTHHIYKENNILYPMAQQFLPSKLLDLMAADFNKANISTPNNEYSDKYLVLVNELITIYLK